MVGAKAILVLVLLGRREGRDRHFNGVVVAVLGMDINVRKEERSLDRSEKMISSFNLFEAPRVGVSTGKPSDQVTRQAEQFRRLDIEVLHRTYLLYLLRGPVLRISVRQEPYLG